MPLAWHRALHNCPSLISTGLDRGQAGSLSYIWRSSSYALSVLDHYFEPPPRNQRALEVFALVKELGTQAVSYVSEEVVEFPLHPLHLLKHVEYYLDSRQVYTHVAGQVQDQL